MAIKINGVDVSYCNPDTDFKALKAAGVKFVIIRTGYLGKTDLEYYDNMRGAQAAGLDVGVYCYCMAKTVEQAKQEAAEVLKLIKPYKISYPVFYDLEDVRLPNNKVTMSLIAIAFLEEIRKGGYYPALYTNPDWLENRLDKSRLTAYDIWLAAWTDNPDKATKYNYNQTMWQWGAKMYSGQKYNTDGDICYIDYPAKIKAAKLNGLTSNESVMVNCVTTDYLSVRALPSAKALRFGILAKGAKVQMVSGTATKSDGYTWVRICYNNNYAWCASEYLKKA